MTKILFTRTIDEATRDALDASDLAFTEASFLRLTPSVSDDLMRQIKRDLTPNLIFTSQNAVRLFFQTLDNQRLKLSQATRTFSASGATQALLKSLGYAPTLAANSARSLARSMLKLGDIKEATFVCGNLRLPDLPETLREGSVAVNELIIYRTEWTSQAIRSAYDAIVFFSPSAVDSFLLNNELPPGIPIFTLGKTTATYLKKKLHAKNVTVSPRPELPALVAAIVEKFKS